MSYLYLKRPGQLPWGYKPCKHDPQLIEPIEAELDALKQAIEYCEVSSFKEVSKWLTAVTGRHLSHAALHKIKHKDFDKQYPSAPSTEKANSVADRPDKGKSGRPQGAKTSPSAAYKLRRRKAAQRREEAKASPKSAGRSRGPTKLVLQPRLEKRTLRERRLKPYPNNL